MKHNYVPGKAYKMRNGEKAVFVGEHPFDGNTLIFAHANGLRHCDYYDCQGSWLRDGTESSLDIIGEWPPEPKKVKGYMAIVSRMCDHTNIENYSGTYFYDTKQKAIERTTVFMGEKIIACIPIEFTEGEGL